MALEAALLETERFNGDPADQLIYAAARDGCARLVSRDTRMQKFDPARAVW